MVKSPSSNVGREGWGLRFDPWSGNKDPASCMLRGVVKKIKIKKFLNLQKIKEMQAQDRCSPQGCGPWFHARRMLGGEG